MKLHIITIGQPKLPFAKAGWDEYLKRLEHYHHIRITHIPDKQNTARSILMAAGNSFKVALEIQGQQLTSLELAMFLTNRSEASKEVSFIIGGPTGLPMNVIEATDMRWSLSQLTFPHDLAMVILVEALYRACTINAGQPYHK